MRELKAFRTYFSLGSEHDLQRAMLSWARVTTDEWERSTWADEGGICASWHICFSPSTPEIFSPGALGLSSAFRTSPCEMTPARTSLAIVSLFVP